MDRYRQRHPLGPQIHAVPDNEKAFDASGKKLPWAYESISTSIPLNDGNERTSREAAEKGPFGKRTGSRRNTSRSRSKTAEPHKAEDVARKEQLVSEERVFGSLRRVVREDSGRGEGADGEGQPPTPVAALAAVRNDGIGEATETLIYGFGEDLQWSAIDFYERVSGGIILEDYDRTPPNQHQAYDPTQSYARSTLTRSLSKAALRKKNKYAGGEHWIKITFSSREAAELAVARSPHIIKGHLVYAEPWQGRGPGKDEAVLATQAGAQVVDDVLPPTFATTNGFTDGVEGSPQSSNTMTSATVERDVNGFASRTGGGGEQAFWSQGSTAVANTGNDLARSQSMGGSQMLQRTGTTRLRGAQLATLLPAEQALMPKQPKQSWSAWLGASELIGTTVPRREDGKFDWERASLYWRLFWWLDGLFGTDFCGVKGDE
ncbi:hypothetical protein LTR86_003353 [Recurvomyces mirabilis]|nr:hypothetical protein LTR86_003353 [Recurvomyces mirabilis]